MSRNIDKSELIQSFNVASKMLVTGFSLLNDLDLLIEPQLKSEISALKSEINGCTSQNFDERMDVRVRYLELIAKEN